MVQGDLTIFPIKIFFFILTRITLLQIQKFILLNEQIFVSNRSKYIYINLVFSNKYKYFVNKTKRYFETTKVVFRF